MGIERVLSPSTSLPSEPVAGDGAINDAYRSSSIIEHDYHCPFIEAAQSDPDISASQLLISPSACPIWRSKPVDGY
jgi:hypothetical protein